MITATSVTQLPSPEESGLRDVRQPAYCWQDNELYDVYQPIIGVYGVVLYVNLSRRATGGECSLSLKELTAETGLAPVTIRRALAALAAIGIIRMAAECGGASEETLDLDLVDLKELAEAHGAQSVQNRRSHVLSLERAAELRRQYETQMYSVA